MNTLQFCALADSYNFTVGNNVRQQQLEVGMPRQVIKFVGAVHQSSVSIIVDTEQKLQYFWAFWRVNQTKAFNWKLIIDNGVLEDVVCRFNNDQAPELNPLGGFVWRITFNIYVTPKKRNPSFDQDLVNLFDGGGNESLELEKIPNIYFPDATGV